MSIKRQPPGRSTFGALLLGPTAAFFLSLIATLLFSDACGSRADERLAEARLALAADQHDEAARHFQEVALSDPSGPHAAEAELELARIQYLHLRDVGEARDRLLRLLAEHGETSAGLTHAARDLLARIYARELNEPERALEHYRVLIEDEAQAEPTSEGRREHLLAMADCYYRLDRLPEARMTYRRALEETYAPSTDAAYFRLARLEHGLGNTDMALDLLDALAGLTPDEASRFDAMATRVEMLLDAGRPTEARRELTEARAAFPQRRELDALSAELESYESEDGLERSEGSLASLEERIPWGGAGRARARARAQQR